MPAATVDDILTLPRIAQPVLGSVERRVRSVTTAPQGYEGEGFPVRRAFQGVEMAALDPFIHLDQMGEVEYAPGEPLGTPWHPHRGFETVTYMIDGTMEHQDSYGGGGVTIPCSMSGWAFDLDLFQPVTSCPAAISLGTMPWPMSPSPMNPIVAMVRNLSFDVLILKAEVRLTEPLVPEKLVRRPLKNDPALLKYIGASSQVERISHVLLHEEY